MPVTGKKNYHTSNTKRNLSASDVVKRRTWEQESRTKRRQSRRRAAQSRRFSKFTSALWLDPSTLTLPYNSNTLIIINYYCLSSLFYLFVGTVDTHSAGDHFEQADGHGDDEILSLDDVHPPDERTYVGH